MPEMRRAASSAACWASDGPLGPRRIGTGAGAGVEAGRAGAATGAGAAAAMLALVGVVTTSSSCRGRLLTAADSSSSMFPQPAFLSAEAGAARVGALLPAPTWPRPAAGAGLAGATVLSALRPPSSSEAEGSFGTPPDPPDVCGDKGMVLSEGLMGGGGAAGGAGAGGGGGGGRGGSNA